MRLHIKVKNNLNFNCILVVSILNGGESSKVTMRKRDEKKERIKPITLLIMMILGKIEKEKEKIEEKMDRRSV